MEMKFTYYNKEIVWFKKGFRMKIFQLQFKIIIVYLEKRYFFVKNMIILLKSNLFKHAF